MKQADPFRGPFVRAGAISRSHARPNDLGRKIEDRGPTGYAPRLLRKGLDALPEQGHICEQAAALREQYETRKIKGVEVAGIRGKEKTNPGCQDRRQIDQPGYEAGASWDEKARDHLPLLLTFSRPLISFSTGGPLTSPSSPRNAWILTARILSSHPADSDPSHDMTCYECPMKEVRRTGPKREESRRSSVNSFSQPGRLSSTI